jgi:hypothetical protein
MGGARRPTQERPVLTRVIVFSGAVSIHPWPSTVAVDKKGTLADLKAVEKPCWTRQSVWTVSVFIRRIEPIGQPLSLTQAWHGPIRPGVA